MIIFIVIVGVAGVSVWWMLRSSSSSNQKSAPPLNEAQLRLLQQHIPFYRALKSEEQTRFAEAVSAFLANKKITPVDTEVEELDRILIAASAIIPIFRLPFWQYDNLHEVLLYPSAFDHDFRTDTHGGILGMVGTGYMAGKMILSKKALRHGFTNDTDKQNTAIHEFVHLIDMADGSVDGIPEVLLQNSPSLPWIQHMHTHIERIRKGKSDIRRYGGTSQVEFFAVASEYFFERPKLLKKKHPEVYASLSTMFRNDLHVAPKVDLEQQEIGRNDPCPCGSGLKYKKCHGK